MKKKSQVLVGDAAVGSTGVGAAGSSNRNSSNNKWNSKNGSSSKKKSKKVTILDDAGSIQEPNTKLSMFDDDDDIAETASQPATATDSISSDKPPLTEVVSKSRSREEKSKNRASGKPIKTSGGLVIPPQFTFSAREVYTSTLGACNPSTVPVEVEQQSPEPPRRKTPPRKWPPPPAPPGNNGSDDKNDPPEKEEEVVEEKQSRMDVNRDDSAVLPLPLLRMTSSLEDLETVPEASTSRETETKASRTIESADADDEDETAPLPNNLSSLTENDRKTIKSPVTPNLATNQDREGPVTSPLTLTPSTDSDDLKQQQQKKKQSVSHRSESFRDLKAKYERKINEQKDQANMLNRLASQRLSEIEKLEGQISEKKDDEEKKISELQVRVELLLLEKEQEIERVRKEMEAEKEEELQRIQKEQKEEVERLRREMNAQKEEAADKKQVSPSRSPSHRAPTGELKRVKRELSDVKRELEAKEKELEKRSPTKSPVRASTGTDTLYRVTKELAEVKDKLTAKEKEIQERDDSAIEKKRTEAELVRVKRELESKKKTEKDLERATRELAKVKEAMAASKDNTSVMTVPSEVEAELRRVKVDFSELTKKLVEKEKELEKSRNIVRPPSSPERERSPIRPYPFPSPGRRRPSETPPKDPQAETDPLRKELDDMKEEAEKAKQQYEQKIAEMRVANEVDLKREREIFRKQKLELDDKVSSAKRENERAIKELRTELEKHIQLAKNATEAQANQQLSKQRELEGALSASCEREAKENGDLEKQVDQLRTEKAAARSKALLEEERAEKLQDQIAVLKKKHSQTLEDHQRSVQDLRAQNRKEMEELRERLEKEKAERESQEEARLRAVTETKTAEKEVLIQKIVALEFDLETERNGATLVDAKFGELEKTVDAEKQRHREETEMLRSKSRAEIEHLKKELDDRMALEEAMQIATNERDAVQEEVQKLTAQLTETSSNHLKNLNDLQEQLTDTKAALDKAVEKNAQLEEQSKKRLEAAEQDADNRCKELREQCESEVEELKKLHIAEGATFAAQLADSKAQIEVLKQEADEKIKKLESELQEKEESCNRKIDEVTELSKGQENKLRSDYTKLKKEHAALERRIKEAEVNHNKQFEDMLSQLDLVEAEHRQALSEKDKCLSEKEAMVDNLGKQLEDAQKTINDVEQRLISQMEVTEQEQNKTATLGKKIEALNDEIESMRESQKKFAREAVRDKERACNNAREEMIEKAEAQFQQANDHYVKLRKQYDEAHDRAKKLEGELRMSKRKAEKLARDKETCELDLNAEIAKLRSANAKIEADSALKAKEYRRELERLLQTAKDFESKSEESERTTRNIQATLVNVVAEKDHLQKEYEEMKSVSEELMAIIEGHNGE